MSCASFRVALASPVSLKRSEQPTQLATSNSLLTEVTTPAGGKGDGGRHLPWARCATRATTSQPVRLVCLHKLEPAS